MFFLFYASFAASWAQTQTAPQKIGVVDAGKALAETAEGRKALADLTARVAPRQKAFEARQSEISQLEASLKNGANLLSAQKKTELARAIEEKKRKLQRDVNDAQDEVQTQQQDVLARLGDKLKSVLQRYARENGYTVILEAPEGSSQVLSAADSIDVTAPVVALYDRTWAAPAK